MTTANRKKKKSCLVWPQKKKKLGGRCDGCFCVLEDRLVEAILTHVQKTNKAEGDLELRAQACGGSILGVLSRL